MSKYSVYDGDSLPSFSIFSAQADEKIYEIDEDIVNEFIRAEEKYLGLAADLQRILDKQGFQEEG